ncbi:hypothetical protein [Streptomyces fumanus]|uniref:hypothetical protein n=1 Tax=Streptomyces fumanus TaxID=67302 RepID=UPI00167E440E|nr:hypothetical protein [Streptomyces fumanus]
MLVVTREGDHRYRLPPHRRALVDLVYLRRHDALAQMRRRGFWVTTPVRRPPHRELTPIQPTTNRASSAAGAPVERGVARSESWRNFRRARCSPNRLTSIAAAILTRERQR